MRQDIKRTLDKINDKRHTCTFRLRKSTIDDIDKLQSKVSKHAEMPLSKSSIIDICLELTKKKSIDELLLCYIEKRKAEMYLHRQK